MRFWKITLLAKVSNSKSSLNSVNTYVDEEFNKVLKGLPLPLINKMKYLYQGKRIRTKLLFNCAKIINCPIPNILIPAFTIELIHTVSLLHDDVIDADLQRRGAKTINEIFDNKTAIFLGSYLIQSLFNKLSSYDKNLKSILLTKIKEVCQGELIQNNYFTIKKKIKKDDILTIAKKKTGALFSLASLLPCLINNKSKKEKSFFEECGYQFGVSYQLLDDVKDVLQDFKKNQNLQKNLNYPLHFFTKKKIDSKKSFQKVKEKIDLLFQNILEKTKKNNYSKEALDFFYYTQKEINLLSLSIME